MMEYTYFSLMIGVWNLGRWVLIRWFEMRQVNATYMHLSTQICYGLDRKIKVVKENSLGFFIFIFNL